MSLYAHIELKISPFYVENGCTSLICSSMQWWPLVNTVTLVKLLLATIKACLIDADGCFLHRFGKVQAWNSSSTGDGSNRERSRKSNNTCYQRKASWRAVCHVALAAIDSRKERNNCAVFIILDWTSVRFELRSAADIDREYWPLSILPTQAVSGRMTVPFSPIVARRSPPS